MRIETRVFLSLFAAIVGGASSLMFLRYTRTWAYATEFRNHILWTALHSIEVFALLLFWFGELQPSFNSLHGITKSIGAAFLGTIIVLLLGSWGLALLVTGQALITSSLAVLLYTVVGGEIVGSSANTK